MKFFQEEDGQTLVEYGLLISLIALIVVGVLTLLGNRLNNTFGETSNHLNTNTE